MNKWRIKQVHSTILWLTQRNTEAPHWYNEISNIRKTLCTANTTIQKYHFGNVFIIVIINVNYQRNNTALHIAVFVECFLSFNSKSKREREKEYRPISRTCAESCTDGLLKLHRVQRPTDNSLQHTVLKQFPFFGITLVFATRISHTQYNKHWNYLLDPWKFLT